MSIEKTRERNRLFLTIGGILGSIGVLFLLYGAFYAYVANVARKHAPSLLNAQNINMGWLLNHYPFLIWGGVALCALAVALAMTVSRSDKVINKTNESIESFEKLRARQLARR